MSYYAFTIPGLEGITAREITDLGGRSRERRRGLVFFEWDGDPATLLHLGTAEDVFALVAREPVSLEKEGLEQIGALVEGAGAWDVALAALHRAQPRRSKRVRFRVVAQRHGGGQRYVRKEVDRQVGEAVAQRFPSWKGVDEDAAVEVWILEENGEALCGVRLSDRTMRHRTYKKSSIAASLRPVIARAMVTLTEPKEEDVFLDPMCGAGTLLIERGESGRYRQLLGGDIREEALDAGRSNIGPRYKPIELRVWDACQLPLDMGSVSAAACNLPFGKKVGEKSELKVLYARFMPELRRVVTPGAVAVLMTSERVWLEQAMAGGDHFYCERLLPVWVLGQKAFLFKLRAI
ncbi:MAG: tRNA (guanine6-N2)-methyltransferase [Candidatus Latescibacterota bacterium]|jgi:tRNA (guanine6-N2)-methyltransferase